MIKTCCCKRSKHETIPNPYAASKLENRHGQTITASAQVDKRKHESINDPILPLSSNCLKKLTQRAQNHEYKFIFELLIPFMLHSISSPVLFEILNIKSAIDTMPHLVFQKWL